VTAKKTTPKVKAAVPSKVIRRLSSVCLINSVSFIALGDEAKTKLLAEAAGLPIEFTDFAQMTDKKAIREGLLAGHDVERRLEFNGIILNDVERAAIKAVNPILEKINGIGPNYSWAAKFENSGGNINCGAMRVRRGGHTVGKKTAEAVWKRASRHWSGGPAGFTFSIKADGSGYNNRTVSIDKNSVTIGCQTIPRAEVEYIARHYGWEPNVFVG
jgi:hypothetical protein